MCCLPGLRILMFFSSFSSPLITDCSHSFRSDFWRGRREGRPELRSFLVLPRPASRSCVLALCVPGQYVPLQVVRTHAAVLAFGTCPRSGDTSAALRGARTSSVYCPYRHVSADSLLQGKGYLSVAVSASSSRHSALARGQARGPPGCSQGSQDWDCARLLSCRALRRSLRVLALGDVPTGDLPVGLALLARDYLPLLGRVRLLLCRLSLVWLFFGERRGVFGGQSGDRLLHRLQPRP